MSMTKHERPGVYSSYDTSGVTSTGTGTKTVGVAAKAAQGDVNRTVMLTSYAECVSEFGENTAMSALARLLFANGASKVQAVRVADEGETADYEASFAALNALEDVKLVVCDSAEEEVQQALRAAVETASAGRKERIAIVGGEGTTAELTQRAAALNSERVVLAAPKGTGADGSAAIFSAAALAGAAAVGSDPAAPLNGAELMGLSGLETDYTDNEVDTLVRGGVTVLESAAGVISPVRCVTTRTKTGGAEDATWRELTTVQVVDDVIPAVRAALRSRFARTKNTAQTRGAIRSQVIVELEKKKAAEIIESYGEVTVEPSADDPAACAVEFSFAVAHGLNQIYLTAHIAI